MFTFGVDLLGAHLELIHSNIVKIAPRYDIIFLPLSPFAGFLIATVHSTIGTIIVLIDPNYWANEFFFGPFPQLNALSTFIYTFI